MQNNPVPGIKGGDLVGLCQGWIIEDIINEIFEVSLEHEDCLQCRFLSICHGGCPVRTYSALGTMLAKDPYCEVYKAVFGRAEHHGRTLLRERHAKGIRPSSSGPGPGSMTTVATPTSS